MLKCVYDLPCLLTGSLSQARHDQRQPHLRAILQLREAGTRIRDHVSRARPSSNAVAAHLRQQPEQLWGAKRLRALLNMLRV